MSAAEPSPASLLVATPLYDGAQAPYMRGILALAKLADQRGIDCQFAFLSHNPSINRARNVLAGIFLESGCSHMLFLDGDIGFRPAEVLDLMAAMQANAELAVIGAPYPKRAINWSAVSAAAARGLAGDKPQALSRFAGVFAIELLEGTTSFKLDAPVELAKLGSAMMMIRRDVIARLYEIHRELAYAASPSDHDFGFKGSELVALFHPMFEPESRYLLSDDYAFCRRVRDAGFRIWMDPMMRTSHTGPAGFHGALSDMAPLYAGETREASSPTD